MSCTDKEALKAHTKNAHPSIAATPSADLTLGGAQEITNGSTASDRLPDEMKTFSPEYAAVPASPAANAWTPTANSQSTNTPARRSSDAFEDESTPGTTVSICDGYLPWSPKLTPQSSSIDGSMAAFTPPENQYQGVSSTATLLQQQDPTSQPSGPAPDFSDWINQPLPAQEFLSQHSPILPTPSFPQQFGYSTHPTEHSQIFSLWAAPPQALRKEYHRPESLQDGQWPTSVPSLVIGPEYQSFPYRQPYQSTTRTIDPRLLTQRGLDEFGFDDLRPNQKETTKVKEAQTAKAAATPAPSLPLTQLPPLPASISDYGFKPKDFEPSTTYTSTLAEKSKFKPFPPDLPEEHIFNADPKQICYGNLLRIATRYSNSQIREKVNEGRPEPVFKSVQVIESRVRSALAWKADKENAIGGFDAVKRSFEEESAKHGIRKRFHEDQGLPYTATLDPQAHSIATPRKRVKLAPRPALGPPEHPLENDTGGRLSWDRVSETAPKPQLRPTPYPMANPNANNAGRQDNQSSLGPADGCKE